jgi:hypothetical protein
MHSSNLAPPQSIAAADYKDRSRGSIDLDARSGGPRDRQMPRRAEESGYLDHRAADVNAVEKFARSRHGNGRKYAHDTDGDRELDERKCRTHLSFR